MKDEILTCWWRRIARAQTLSRQILPRGSISLGLRDYIMSLESPKHSPGFIVGFTIRQWRDASDGQWVTHYPATRRLYRRF